MISNINIILGDNLSREIYSFYIEDFDKIWLDWYCSECRESNRHKFVRIGYYSRLEKRNSNIAKEDVLITETIKNAVKEKIISSIQIKKWSERE